MGSPPVVGAVVAAATVMVAAGGAGALEVSVRGEARIATGVKTAGTTVQLAGRLHDDLGEPVPQQPVELQVYDGDESVVDRQVLTDFHGTFSTIVQLAPGDYRVEFDYPGSSHLTGTRASTAVQVEAAPAEVQIKAPRWVHGAEAAVMVQMSATVDGTGLPSFAGVVVDGRPALSATLDGSGQAQVDIAPFLDTGDHEVAVRVDGTEHRDAQVETTLVRRVDELVIDGDVRRVFERRRRGRAIDVEVTGNGDPVEDAQLDVELIAVGSNDEEEGGEESATIHRQVSTDADGTASVLIGDDELADRSWDVYARVQPPAGPPEQWQGERIETETPLWFRVGRLVAVLVLVAGGAWFSRRAVFRAGDRLVARLLRRGDDTGEPEPSPAVIDRVERVELAAEQPPEEDGGTETDDAVVVQLWDRWRGEPVAGARVEIVADGGDGETMEVGPEGRVEIGGVGAECVEIHAEAHGFVPAQARLDATGVGSTVRMAMTPVPLKIRQAFRSFAGRLQGEDPWGRLTPRQVAAAMEAMATPEDGDAGDGRDGTVGETVEPDWRALFEQLEQAQQQERTELLVRALAAAVEETNFSGRDYDVAVWDDARQVIQQLMQRLDQHRQGGQR